MIAYSASSSQTGLFHVAWYPPGPAAMGYHLTAVRMAMIKKITNKCWEDMDKGEQ